jgi:hypothetical protein
MNSGHAAGLAIVQQVIEKSCIAQISRIDESFSLASLSIIVIPFSLFTAGDR